MSIPLAFAILAALPAASLSLHAGATMVTDKDRPAARIWHVDLYTPEPQPYVGTLAFKDILAVNAGRDLRVCVRSRATKPGAVVVMVPRATVDIIDVPTGGRYRTRCAEITVRKAPKSRPGFVQVANDGPVGRVDFIRSVSVRSLP